jgi:DNA-nicking Smr family endonuclease
MNRKHIDLADHALWDEIRRSVTPLLRKHPRSAVKAKAMAKTAILSIRSMPVPHHHAPAAMRKALSDSPPPLAQLDRRTAQRLNRGQIEPEARLDLHGEGVETARIKLLHFLSRERQRGSRHVLVITGKGASPYARHTLHGTSHFHTPEREGRLRREVPLWLNEDSFRQHALAIQPAHPKHGGGGAFYIRLRKSAPHT